MPSTETLVLTDYFGAEKSSLPELLTPTDLPKNHLCFRRRGNNRGLGDFKFLVLDLTVEADVGGVLGINFIPRGAGPDSPAIHGRWGLLPRVPTRVVVPLSIIDGQTLFLHREPLRLKATIQGRRTPIDEIESIVLRLVDARPGVKLRFNQPPRLATKQPSYPRVKQVLVDELGQWAGRGWTGKTKNAKALIGNLRKALSNARKIAFPPGLSEFGGSRAHRFDSTGRFRTHHDGKRWWLVDPAGCGFYSAGVDCVSPLSSGPILPGTRHHYAWLPPKRGKFADAWTQHKSGTPHVSFDVTNLIRAFGADWRKAWDELTTDVFCRARFNTVGNWSNLDYARSGGLPYVVPMPWLNAPGSRLFRSLADVFDPAYARECKSWAQWLKQFRNDPRLIGYFMTNEPDWAFGKHNLASEMLEANPGTHTRKAFAKFLRQRYRNDAKSFARAWNAPGKGFSAIVQFNWRRAEDISDGAQRDTWEFSKQIIRRWIGCMTEACRKVLPDHLNLGVRWAWISSDLCYEVSDYCDVFTINNYNAEPPLEQFTEISKRTGKPVMLGEFHHGATDRGLPSSGIQAVASAKDRGVAYRRYVELCAAHPACIGTHYFQYNDQPLMGRFDGENYNIGFVDVCLQPYPELLNAARSTHQRLYAIADGSVEPISRKAKGLPPIFF